MGKSLNLDCPILFQEKLNWLKLYYRRNDLGKFVDKYEVKKYIEQTIGKKYVVPYIGVWNHFDEIDFNKLPNQFVLKCTHDSGSYCICKDKASFDIKKARKRINKGMRREYFYAEREWPYRLCSPRILAEELLIDNKSSDLIDYKFFFFNGEPKFMYISSDISENATTDFFDMDFQHLNMRMKDPNSEILPQKPKYFEEMKSLAKILCKDFPHVRIDFYVVNDQIYFGEFTFFHNGGFQKIYPEEWNKILGDWILLPSSKCSS